MIALLYRKRRAAQFGPYQSIHTPGVTRSLQTVIPPKCSILAPESKICDQASGSVTCRLAPPAGEAAGDDAAVVEDDDFLHEREAEAGPVALRREERLKDALARRGGNARPVVGHGDAGQLLWPIDLRPDGDHRRDGGARAGFDGVPQQIAERLPQQHLVPLHGPELAGDDDVAAQGHGVGPDLVGGAFADGAQIHARQRQLRRPREVEEIGDDLAERFCFGANAFDVRPVRVGQRIQIEQLAVSMNRRKAVAELVRDPRGQLSDGREAVLQPQLLLEILDRRQVGEETDRPVQLSFAVEQRRHGHAEVDAASDLSAASRRGGRSAWRVFRHSSMTSSSGCSRGDGMNEAASGSSRIRRPAGLRVVTSPLRPTTMAPAVRLEMISPLRRSDASARAAIARSCSLQLGDGILQRRRQQRRVGAARSRTRLVSRAAAISRSRANVSTATRQATMAVRPISAYPDGEIFIGAQGSGVKRYHAAISPICSRIACRLACRSASVMPTRTSVPSGPSSYAYSRLSTPSARYKRRPLRPSSPNTGP